MDNASAALLALKPVTFRYKKEIDSKGIPQFSLVAEEGEKVNPVLVLPSGAGTTACAAGESAMQPDANSAKAG